MGKWSAERLAAASGFVFVALYIVAFFVAGKPPTLSSSNAKVASYFVDHHRAGLVQAIALGLAVIAFIWFLGSLGAALRKAGEGRLASIAWGGGIVAAGLAMLATTINAALFMRVALESPAMAGGLYVLSVTAFTVIGFAIGAVALSTAIAVWRSKVFPGWYAIVCTVAGIVFVFGGGALVHSGFYSPDGAYSMIVNIVFVVWMLVTTSLLVQHAAAAEQEAPRPVMAH